MGPFWAREAFIRSVFLREANIRAYPFPSQSQRTPANRSVRWLWCRMSKGPALSEWTWGSGKQFPLGGLLGRFVKFVSGGRGSDDFGG